MNPEDIINQMRGQTGSVLSRQPTIAEIDEFLSRCIEEKDETIYTIFQSLAFKLERGVHSAVEAEIFPQIIKRIQERMNKGEQ